MDAPGLDGTRVSELMRRIETLERRARRLNYLALVLAGAAGIAAASRPEAEPPNRSCAAETDQNPLARTVTATSFVLLDAEGRKRAELRDGQMTFFDVNGVARLLLGTSVPTGKCESNTEDVSAGMASLQFNDAQGKVRASWGAHPNGWSTLAFFDAGGKGCANLNVSDDCRSGLALGHGEPGFGRMWTDESGQVNIDLLDGEKVRWTTR